MPLRAAELLLDGQQRATSLYGVIRGEAPAFFRGDESAFEGLYFCPQRHTMNPDQSQEQPL